MELNRIVVELTESVVRLFNDMAYNEFIAVRLYLQFGYIWCPGRADSHVLPILAQASQVPEDIRQAVWNAAVLQIDEAMDAGSGQAYKRVIMSHVLDEMEAAVMGVDNVADTIVGLTLAMVERSWLSSELFTLSSTAVIPSGDHLSRHATWVMLLDGTFDDASDASRFLNEATKRFGRRL